jgi:hypothetical protein
MKKRARGAEAGSKKTIAAAKEIIPLTEREAELAATVLKLKSLMGAATWEAMVCVNNDNRNNNNYE